MKMKKSFLIICLFIFFIGMTSVCAVEVNDTLTASEDDLQTELTQDSIDEISTANTKTFSDLNDTINGNNDSDIYLNEDYSFKDGPDRGLTDGIVIDRAVTVYGNGHTLNAKNSARMFVSNNNETVFRDIVFINGMTNDEGGAIYGRCIVVNCTFIENQANKGGAIDGGTCENCTFIKNVALALGGAIFVGRATNCLFKQNTACNRGGAMFWSSAYNCTFIQNNANQGGATDGCRCDDCTFILNCALEDDNENFGSSLNENCIVIDDAVFTVSNFNSSYGSGEKLLFNLTHDGKQLNNVDVSIEIYQNGSPVDAYYCSSDGGWVVCLEPGTYTAVLNVPLTDMEGHKNVKPVSAAIEVDKATTMFSADNLTTIYNHDDYLVVTLNDYFNNTLGNVSLTVNMNGNNVSRCSTDENGQIKISSKGMVPNDYIFDISFEGDKLRSNSSVRVKISVGRDATQLTARDIIMDYNGESNLTVTLSDGAGNPMGGEDIIVYLGGYEKFRTNQTGEIAMPLRGLASNRYQACVLFLGNEMYNASIMIVNITVNKDAVQLNATKNLTAVYGRGDSLNITLSDSRGMPMANAKILLYMGTVKKECEMDDNGQVHVPIAGLDAGEYLAGIFYGGDENHTWANGEVNVTIIKDRSEISSSNVYATYSMNKYLIVTLKDSKGNPISGAGVTVNINGLKNYITDKNGQIKVPTNGLVPKKYVAKIAFNGNANFLKSSKSVKVTVKKASAKLTAKAKSFKANAKTKKYSLILKTNSKKPLKKVKITLKVNGITYKATTNKKGKATFKITKLSEKGKHTAVIKFKGNKYYNPVTKKVKIKIR